ncbi:MAG: hypothetical protein CMO80_06375 [Verrucomicrobiales bacterium]|nr:hypothetical protein [Verrucomicrobiales bacterium]|tara:strand:+ start:806 stop:1498 length:693 start_codon:yes stop_codon:yes gene_type:complete
MSLLGKAVMLAWHDLKEGAHADHDDWHSHEHMFERVGIEGFRRGRRCRGVDESPEQYFLMYEVDDLSVLTSDAYLTRLNNPTPWSARIIPTIENMNRTLCNVRYSYGGGLGTIMLTMRFSAAPDRENELSDWLAVNLNSLPARRGVVGAHLAVGDLDASGVTTDEIRLRGGSDQHVDQVLLVDGYEEASLRSLDLELTDALMQHGAQSEPCSGLYCAVHVVSESDLPLNV